MSEKHKAIMQVLEFNGCLTGDCSHQREIECEYATIEAGWQICEDSLTSQFEALKKENERLKKRLSGFCHNHPTRDIKEKGKCPACDRDHEKQKLTEAIKALEFIDQQDRGRGYPTGIEWTRIVSSVKETLAKLRRGV